MIRRRLLLRNVRTWDVVQSKINIAGRGESRMMKRAYLFLLILFLAGCTSQTPQHNRAKELGLDYSEKHFQVYVTGERKLGSDENFELYGHVKPVKKIIDLGQQFELSREGIYSLSAVLTEIDKDHYRLKGHYVGKDRIGNGIDMDLDVVIPFGIHGGTHYFQDPKMEHMSSAGLHNDYLSIQKIEKRNLPGMTNAGDGG